MAHNEGEMHGWGLLPGRMVHVGMVFPSHMPVMHGMAPAMCARTHEVKDNEVYDDDVHIMTMMMLLLQMIMSIL